MQIGNSIRMWVVLALAMGVSSMGYAERGDCKNDVQKFCGQVEKGEGRIRHCLKEHEGELSEACKSHLQEARQKIRAFGEACKDDKLKYCKDTQPGKGRIIECLKEHQADLSASCQQKITEVGSGEEK